MARVQSNDPGSRGAKSPDAPRQKPASDTGADPKTQPASGDRGATLFRALVTAGIDPATAYTATQEAEFVTGQDVNAALGARMDAFETRMDAFEARMEAANALLLAQLQALTAAVMEIKADLANVKTDVAALKTDVAVLKTDVAVLKREVRLIWACLFLLVPTITAFLVRFLAA